MEITDVKIRKYNSSGAVRAVVSFVLDEQLAVHEVQVVDNGERIFVSMPQRLDRTIWRDIVHPINTEFREKLETAILQKYYDHVAELNADPSKMADKDASDLLKAKDAAEPHMNLLTDREVDVMMIIWESPSVPTSTGEIFSAINLAKRNSLQTLQVVLRRLCDKGMLTCEKGKQMNYYRALVTKEDYLAFSTDNFLAYHFHGSIKRQIGLLVKSGKLTNQDLNDLCAYLDARKAALPETSSADDNSL